MMYVHVYMRCRQSSNSSWRNTFSTSTHLKKRATNTSIYLPTYGYCYLWISCLVTSIQSHSWHSKMVPMLALISRQAEHCSIKLKTLLFLINILDESLSLAKASLSYSSMKTITRVLVRKCVWSINVTTSLPSINDDFHMLIMVTPNVKRDLSKAQTKPHHFTCEKNWGIMFDYNNYMAYNTTLSRWK